MRPSIISFFVILLALPASTTRNDVQAPRLITHEDGITGEYIVALAPRLPAGNLDLVVAELVREFGGELIRQYRNVFPGFSVRLRDEQALALSRHPAVALVEQNIPVYPSGVQINPANWALDRIDQRSASLNYSYSYTSTGNGVNVYIVDSGIRFDHAEFGGRAVFAVDFVNDGRAGWDCYGHGTAVAGLVGGSIYGVAKQARLHSVRILGCQRDDSSDSERMISAFEWLIYHHVKPAVVNVSFNYNQPSTRVLPCEQRQPHILINEAARALLAAGVPLVNSAGNQDCPVNTAPALADRNVIVVGSTWWNGVDRWQNYTAWGGDVDVWAPGNYLTTASNSSSTAWGYFSNTSASAAVVSGVVARYLETHPGASPGGVNFYLISNATRGIIQGLPDYSGGAMIYADPQL